MNFDAVIIGGGLGRLTAGATLSRWGKRVLLLEQHYIPGGCATTFKRKDYVMEVGLHELSGLHDADLKHVQANNKYRLFVLEIPDGPSM